jgi:tetratricopeptide (TPR) repeat protein
LLASVLLQQGEGDAALNALGNVGEGHGALALARAAAALLTESRESLERAKRELASYRGTADGKGDPEATSIMIRVDMRLGANVESLLPAARALVQRSPETPSTHLALAEALVNAEQGPQAIAALEPALKLAPGSADAHYLMGGAQRLAGHPTEARASLERAVAIAPNHLEARRALGRMLLDSGDFDAALQLFRGLEGAGGDSAKLGAVEALLGKNKFEEVATRIDALPEHVKASLAGELLKARFDLARGKPQAAVDALAPLVDEHAETRSADGLVVYGDALYALGRVDSAALAFDGALELDDKHPDALLGRATAAIHAEKADQTAALVERAEAALALRARPPRTRARALVLAGRAELGKGQVAKARESLARAVAIAEAPADAHFWYAEALTRAKEASARDEYTKYLQLEPAGALAARAKRALTGR